MTSPTCGYSCSQFVDLAPEYIRCGVCRNVLRDPQLTECCGRNVCHPCIEEMIKTGDPCPLADCRRPLVKVSFNRKCRDDIDERRVYCSSKSNGCQWIGKLEKLERHLAGCAFVEEECHYCGAHVQRQHEKEHKEVCKQYPIRCSQCGMTYERHYQSEHIKLCVFETVKCPFSIVGCTSEILNKDMQQHLSNFLPDHYTLVAKLVCDTEAETKAIETLVLQKYEEKTTQLKAEIDGLNAAICKAHKQISLLQQALYKGEKEMRELQKAQETTSHKFAAQIGVGTAEIEAIKESIERLQFNSKIKLYGPPLPCPRKLTSRPSEVPPTDPLLPPFTFKIANFHEKKKHDVIVYSPPFFTHHRGYKLCLQVSCNGIHRGKGKYLAIYACLLKGEYDKYLRWPFRGSITIEIRNLLKDAHHCTQRIIFDRQSNAGARVEGEECFSQSRNLGIWNIIPFSELLPAITLFLEYQYIKNGCLSIDVSSAKVLR